MADDYESMMTDEHLANYSAWLYEQYLAGEDYLDDIHRVAEILRERQHAKD